MISVWVVIYIIFAHWVADFIFQDEKWALGKSKNTDDLLAHTCMYSSIMGLFSMFLFPTGIQVIIFVGITFICHTITDYFTSKVVKDKFEKKELGGNIPNLGGFTYIGGDQVLHYIQLFLSYLLVIML